MSRVRWFTHLRGRWLVVSVLLATSWLLLGPLPAATAIDCSGLYFAHGTWGWVNNYWVGTPCDHNGEYTQGIQTIVRDELQGCDPGPIDGIWGPQTLNAVKCYQGHHSLDADGIVGDDTWAALRADIRKTWEVGSVWYYSSDWSEYKFRLDRENLYAWYVTPLCTESWGSITVDFTYWGPTTAYC